MSRITPSGIGREVSEELYHKKLDAHLSLLYQAYLKKETLVEAEIKTALLGRVKQDEDFAFKIRMMQLDYLKLENKVLEGEWNETTDVLFPIIEVASELTDENRKKILIGYKETIFELLKSSSEFSS